MFGSDSETEDFWLNFFEKFLNPQRICRDFPVQTGICSFKIFESEKFVLLKRFLAQKPAKAYKSKYA